MRTCAYSPLLLTLIQSLILVQGCSQHVLTWNGTVHVILQVYP